MEVNRSISTVLIIIITLVLVFLFVMPKYAETKKLEGEVSLKSSELNGLSLYYQKISDLKKEIEKRKESLDKIESSLPVDPPLSGLVYFLQSKTTASSLAIRSMALSQQATNPKVKSVVKIKKITFLLDVVGSYQAMRNFVRSLERSSRIFEIENISFSSASSLQAKVSQNVLQIYSFKLQISTNSY